MTLTPSPLPSTRRTGLVLGGGGSAGNAWLIGVVAGLAAAGADVTRAHVTVGTSAGATVAAQLAGSSPARLLADIVEAPIAEPPTRTSSARAKAGPPRPNHLERLTAAIAASRSQADLRGRLAPLLAADPASHPAAQARWRDTVAQRFANHAWPIDRTLRITAVDAGTTEPVVFDRDSGVDLVDAVAASCAGGFVYTIGDHRYFDGGYRRGAENADLASDCDRVLVLSPFGGRSLVPAAWGTHFDAQIDDLRANGCQVETIFPDAASVVAFGDNMMDPRTRPPAARAGFELGLSRADALARFASDDHPRSGNGSSRP